MTAICHIIPVGSLHVNIKTLHGILSFTTKPASPCLLRNHLQPPRSKEPKRVTTVRAPLLSPERGPYGFYSCLESPMDACLDLTEETFSVPSQAGGLGLLVLPPSLPLPFLGECWLLGWCRRRRWPAVLF